MAYAGSLGETQKQISNIFNFPVSQENLHPVFNALCLDLASRSKGAKGKNGNEFKLNIFNQLFIQDGFNLLKDYLDELALYYGAGVGILDFENEPEKSALAINRWIEDNTEGLIKDMLAKKSINNKTRLAIVNTIYIDAAWEKQFNESLTTNRDFYLEDGSIIQADMMQQAASFSYSSGNDYVAIDLPLSGNEMSMLLIKPKSLDISSFEKQFNTDKLNEIISDLNTGSVKFFLPKFNISGDTMNLKDTLIDMGMSEPFTDNADFSGITEEMDLKIDQMNHKAFIDVDELGISAGAATIILFSETCIGETPVELVFNRSFIFIIRDFETHSILFMGRVSNPS